MSMSTQLNDGGTDAQRHAGGLTEIASSRQAQEVQAAMIVAQRCPRDENRAVQRILTACKRKALAESAIYQYPRGGQKVSGLSIRAAEVLAQCWGNIDFGIVEVEQNDGISTVQAYAWDLETNTRQTKIFHVRHERHTRDSVARLTDPRDIYEAVANQGARRLRACILGIIPGDIQDAAEAACIQTLTSGSDEPLIDRARKMLAAFSKHGVTQAMIEAKLGHNLDAIDEHELVELRKVYTSIKDGMSERGDWFDLHAKATKTDEAPASSKAERVAKKTNAQKPEFALSDRLKDFAGKLKECESPDEVEALFDLVIMKASGVDEAEFTLAEKMASERKGELE